MTIPVRRRALLIHVEHYEDSRFAPLPSAHEGVEQVAEALREVADVEVTVCAELTFGALRGTVARFCADRDPDEFALLHLACRSAVAPTGELVFAAADTDPLRLVETGLTAEFLATCLEDCWAEHKVAVLDCPDPGRAPAESVPLPAPSGVYLLAGDPAEESTAFADAITTALRAGAAAGRLVTTDDIFDAAQAELGARTPPRAATVSAVRASGRIPVAAPPLATGPPPQQPPPPTRRPTRSPGWRELLAYYRDAVRAGAGALPLLDPQGNGHLLLDGRERVLLDDVDEDGCIPLPVGAESLVESLRAAGREDRTLWAGWPLVVLHGDPVGRAWPAPMCAPLFVRRLEAVVGPRGTRLRPIGQAVPHLGLAHLRLGAEEATTLVACWVPGWRRGEAERLADDAVRLLREELGMPCPEQLRPDALATRLDTRGPVDGARNVAALFTAGPAPAVIDLLTDLDAVARRPEAVGASALAALLPGGGSGPDVAPVTLVTPQALTATQYAVLHSAMTRRLTAVTGPAGTGKTRLVVDAVATAVASGQSVLVAARTDRAVDEIVERCRRVLPGLLMRAGHRDGGDAEAGELDELLTLTTPRGGQATRQMAFRYAEHLVATAEAALRAVGEQETELLALGRARTAAHGRLGYTGAELTQRLGPGWGERARALAGARLFGERRRRRFLQDVDLPPGPGRTAETCVALARLDDIDRRWQAACAAARSATPDAELRAALAGAQRRMERASRELLAGVVLAGVDRGRAALTELRSVRRRGTPDRAAFHHALPHLRGWAVAALKARRLPVRPALFDLVVIDEAQHCPLPEAVPLLFRARRALVIGDAAALPHVDVVPARTDAALRDRYGVPRDWLTRTRLSPVRHSLLAAAERAGGPAEVLDEHYRSHPDIAELVNRLGSGRRLHVLTDIGRGTLPVRRAVMWRDVHGRAERGPNRTSWRNRAEADEVERCVWRLLERLPPAATVAVVAPYRAQADELAARFAGEPRVLVGTPSAFQGREHHALVVSLVADDVDHRFDRAQRQRELWSVALSRARYLLVAVGNEAVWDARGGVGGEVARVARGAGTGRAVDDDLADLLDSALSEVPGASFEVAVRGHATDAVLGDGGLRRPVLIDRGAPGGTDPAVHLARMLRLLDVLGDAAVRLPGWVLHDSADAARTHLVF